MSDIDRWLDAISSVSKIPTRKDTRVRDRNLGLLNVALEAYTNWQGDKLEDKVSSKNIENAFELATARKELIKAQKKEREGSELKAQALPGTDFNNLQDIERSYGNRAWQDAIRSNPQINAYITADPKDPRFQSYGAYQQHVKQFGPPVDPKFNETLTNLYNANLKNIQNKILTGEALATDEIQPFMIEASKMGINFDPRDLGVLDILTGRAKKRIAKQDANIDRFRNEFITTGLQKGRESIVALRDAPSETSREQLQQLMADMPRNLKLDVDPTTIEYIKNMPYSKDYFNTLNTMAEALAQTPEQINPNDWQAMVNNLTFGFASPNLTETEKEFGKALAIYDSANPFVEGNDIQNERIRKGRERLQYQFKLAKISSDPSIVAKALGTTTQLLDATTANSEMLKRAELFINDPNNDISPTKRKNMNAQIGLLREQNENIITQPSLAAPLRNEIINLNPVSLLPDLSTVEKNNILDEAIGYVNPNDPDLKDMAGLLQGIMSSDLNPERKAYLIDGLKSIVKDDPYKLLTKGFDTRDHIEDPLVNLSRQDRQDAADNLANRLRVKYENYDERLIDMGIESFDLLLRIQGDLVEEALDLNAKHKKLLGSGFLGPRSISQEELLDITGDYFIENISQEDGKPMLNISGLKSFIKQTVKQQTGSSIKGMPDFVTTEKEGEVVLKGSIAGEFLPIIADAAESKDLSRLQKKVDSLLERNGTTSKYRVATIEELQKTLSPLKVTLDIKDDDSVVVGLNIESKKQPTVSSNISEEEIDAFIAENPEFLKSYRVMGKIVPAPTREDIRKRLLKRKTFTQNIQERMASPSQQAFRPGIQ